MTVRRGRVAGSPDGPGPVRAGFEVELLAPRGATRFDLADDLARRFGGSVRRRFHLDTEGSLLEGVSAFWHLTPAFDVVDRSGRLFCRIVDDMTIVDDLDPAAPPEPGWYRIVSDEPRLLRLVQRYADPSQEIGTVLDRAARLFGTGVTRIEELHRLDDASGATIAMVAPLTGDRHRPCEVITPPLNADHADVLEALLGPARDLGFTVPAEAAVHVHLDAEPFRDVGRFTHVVRTFGERRAELHRSFATNPRCRRLSPVPAELLELVDRDWPDWASLRAAAARTPVTKFSDVNLTHVLGVRPGPDTLEVRILAGSADGRAIGEQFAELLGLLR